MPIGMSSDPYSGNLLLQPTADQVGMQNGTVPLADSASLSVAQSFAVRVRGADLPPVAFTKTLAASRAINGWRKHPNRGSPQTASIAKSS